MTSDIVDTNVWLGRWPFRHLAAEDADSLARQLAAAGVKQAWAGSFEGLFHRDVAAVNERLAADCRATGDALLLPFGTVNLRLPDWQDDLRRCHEAHGMRGIRLAPAYHGYGLDDRSLPALLHEAAQRRLVVELLLSLEDARTQHPLARVRPVDLSPLAEVVRPIEGLRLVCLGAFHAANRPAIERAAAAGEVYFEIATLEGTGGVVRLIEWVTIDRVLFGSAAGFFYFQAARLKLQEAELAGKQIEQICFGNAWRVMSELESKSS